MIFCNSSSLGDDFKHSTLFFDNNALIALLSNDELLDLFHEIRAQETEFLVIPSVAIEFMRTDSIENYNNRAAFLNTFCKIYPFERTIDINDPLIFVFNKINKPDFVDLILCLVLHQFRTAYLVTENHSHFLTNVMDRTHVITIDKGDKQIRNIGIYKINSEKLNNVTESILEH